MDGLGQGILKKYKNRAILVLFFSIYYVIETLAYSDSYVDLYLESKKKIAKYNIMIELKYIKKSEYSDDLLEEKKKEAIEQLKNIG